MITKTELDKLVKEYETIEFIKQDPIQIPHRYIDEKEIELVGFISALFAYGSRKVFIPKLDFLFLSNILKREILQTFKASIIGLVDGMI